MTTAFWRGFLSVSLAAASLSSAAFAVDGVTQIDPDRVRRGNITPGDAAGFPVTISQAGSYVLTGNLVVSDPMTTAIEITADNVTLDLNGFSIIGPNVCTGTPVRCTFSGGGIGVVAVAPVGVVSPSSVRVMNGTVRGMGFHGVRMLGDATMVERVTALSNGGPGIVVGNGSVVDCAAISNGSGSAIVGSIVRGSIASNNASAGISLRPGGVATGNTAYGNGGSGISVDKGSASNNSAVNNGGYGMEATCPSSLTGNTTFNNLGGSVRTSQGVCTFLGHAQ